MVAIRYLELFDKEFWYKLDKHLPKTKFENLEVVSQFLRWLVETIYKGDI